MATSQSTTPDGVQTLKFKHGVVTNNQNPYKVGYDNGTIYFVEESTSNDPRSYIYLNGKNIIPEMLDVRNGGLGADLSEAHPASVYIRSTGYATATVRTDAGAFYAEGQDGIPTFGTLPVDYGGTGITSITPGSLLYGGSDNTMDVLAAGTNGQIIVSDGAKPIYTSPAMQWTASETPDTTGPRFDFKFNDEVFAGEEIPAASYTASGIVTTGTQIFAGIKTFKNEKTITTNINPLDSKTYTLGYWTSTTDHRVWANIFTNAFTVVSPYTNNLVATLSVDSANKTLFEIVGTKGNAIRLGHRAGNYLGSLIESHATSSRNFYLPNVSGLAMVLTSAAVENTSTTTYAIPYLGGSTSQNRALSATASGFQITDYYGTTTADGLSQLILGNSTSSGAEGNKKGSIRLYGDKTYYTDLIPKTNLTTNYALTLPAANGELTWHNANARQGGPSNVDTPTDYALLKVETTGQIKADTTTSIASSDGDIMYLGSGALKKSAATIGTSTVPVYLKEGTITQCTAANVFSNFSSTPGTDDGEELSITVAGKNRKLVLDAATATQSGVVTIEEQTFAGNKIFNDNVDISGDANVDGELNVANYATFGLDVDLLAGRLHFYEEEDTTKYCSFEYDGSTDTLTLSFTS